MLVISNTCSIYFLCYAFSVTNLPSRRISEGGLATSSHTRGGLTSTKRLLGPTSTDTSHNSLSIGIVGAGAVALGTAAILSEAGYSIPMLWSPSGREPPSKSITADFPTPETRVSLEFEVRWARTVEELVASNQIIILALPANGHKSVMDQMVPWLRGDQTVIISSHASFGALYMTQQIQYSQQMERNDPVPSLPLIVAFGTTLCTARRPVATSNDLPAVRINTIRQAVDFCTLPLSASNVGLELCQSLFPQIENFQLRQGLLAIALSNLNPQNHLGIALGNISRMEKGEEWYQSQHITPAIGRLLEALDEERLNIAEALELETKTIFEHFSLSFHVPISESISDMNQQIFQEGRDVLGPNSVDSRYITEDVPFGLVPTIMLGQLVGRPATLHESGVRMISAMHGRDFAAENDLLNALRLETYGLEELQEASETGILKKLPHHHDLEVDDSLC